MVTATHHLNTSALQHSRMNRQCICFLTSHNCTFPHLPSLYMTHRSPTSFHLAIPNLRHQFGNSKWWRFLLCPFTNYFGSNTESWEPNLLYIKPILAPVASDHSSANFWLKAHRAKLCSFLEFVFYYFQELKSYFFTDKLFSKLLFIFHCIHTGKAK